MQVNFGKRCECLFRCTTAPPRDLWQDCHKERERVADRIGQEDEDVGILRELVEAERATSGCAICRGARCERLGEAYRKQKLVCGEPAGSSRGDEAIAATETHSI